MTNYEAIHNMTLTELAGSGLLICQQGAKCIEDSSITSCADCMKDWLSSKCDFCKEAKDLTISFLQSE